MKKTFTKARQKQVKKEIAKKLRIDISAIFLCDYFYDSSDDSMSFTFEVYLPFFDFVEVVKACINNWSEAEYAYLVL